MLSSDDKIIKEKDFVFNGIKYTARLYSHENKPMLYGEIVYSDNNQRVHNMKGKWLKWSKISLLLVCFGFFMPVSCDMNGADLARMFNQIQSPGYAILIWLVLIAAILSIIYTLYHAKKLESESVIVDWILLGGSVSGGLFFLGRMSREYFNLQAGAYVIIAGWILSLVFLIIACCSKRE